MRANRPCMGPKGRCGTARNVRTLAQTQGSTRRKFDKLVLRGRGVPAWRGRGLGPSDLAFATQLTALQKKGTLLLLQTSWATHLTQHLAMCTVARRLALSTGDDTMHVLLTCANVNVQGTTGACGQMHVPLHCTANSHSRHCFHQSHSYQPRFQPTCPYAGRQEARHAHAVANTLT